MWYRVAPSPSLYRVVRNYMGLLKFLSAVKFHTNPAMRVVMVTLPLFLLFERSCPAPYTHTLPRIYMCTYAFHITFCSGEGTT